MMPLLRDMPAGGPADWLLARIKARRAALLDSWDELIVARTPPESLPPAPWRSGLSAGEPPGGLAALQREYARAFRCMEMPLRRLTLPLFWLAELKTLAITLRLRIGGRAVDWELLRGSLLNEQVKAVLVEPADGIAAIGELAKVLSPHDPTFQRLPEAYRTGGGAALEGALYDISLEHFAAAPGHPVMARYLGLLIDSRNLITLAKQLHWRLTAPPPFLRGGGFAPPVLERLFSRGDASGIAALVARLGGRSPTGLPGDVEHGVLEAQGRTVRRLGREPEGAGPILDYLWRCGQECRNIGLLACLASAGAADVGDEIVA